MAAWVTGNVRMLALNAIKFKVHHVTRIKIFWFRASLWDVAQAVTRESVSWAVM